MSSDRSTVAVAACVAEPGRLLRLRIEFAILFLVFPLLMAMAFPPSALGEALIGMTVVAVALLALTPGFRWRSLLEGGITRHWGVILLFAALTAAIATTLVLWLVPDRFLSLPQTRPELWIRILILYPLLSVLPQELFFRALFFERYGVLFTEVRTAMVVNALCFGLAHVFYANWLAVLLTTVGGAFFTWAYGQRRSFPLAFLLHVVAGHIIFTTGLGIFFYHGAVKAVG